MCLMTLETSWSISQLSVDMYPDHNPYSLQILYPKPNLISLSLFNADGLWVANLWERKHRWVGWQRLKCRWVGVLTQEFFAPRGYGSRMGEGVDPEFSLKHDLLFLLSTLKNRTLCLVKGRK